MRKNGWLSLSCAVFMALFVGACSDDTGTDGMVGGEGILDGLVTPDGLTTTDGAVTDGAPTDGTVPAAEYKYVKIEDLSTVTGAQDGADIDAVELQKAGGSSSWASASESCKLPDGSDCANPDEAVGQSDAFCTDTTRCYSNFELPTDDPSTKPPYSSLGGFDGTTSGTQILLMSEKIENGDKLIVYEVGNCEISESCSVTNTVTASAESIKVSVGTSASGPWTEVLAASDTNNHPKVEITISGLQ